jgi:hypothetical protein
MFTKGKWEHKKTPEVWQKKNGETKDDGIVLSGEVFGWAHKMRRRRQDDADRRVRVLISREEFDLFG